MNDKDSQRPAEAADKDRRAGKDRRQKELAPPGGRERRRNLEPRKPDVAEIDLTSSQWDALNELPFPGKDPA